jgi:hypothetical protein
LNPSTFEQTIYNTHLKHFRNGGPWKPRKDFSDINDSTSLYLRKLSQFFKKFNHINVDDFFAAPKFLHPDEETPPLKFFITRAAIKNYTLMQKQKINASPEKQTESIKKGFEYIALFCLEKSILLSDYTNFQEGNGPAWLEHYRTNSINPYCLMELLNFSKLAEMTENVVWDNKITDNFFAFRNRYHLSSETKNLVKEGTKKIQQFLKEKLNSQP